MAERRMFAKTIVLSDAFLDMPTSARCLYFMLGMLADDDGFVNSPKAVTRQCGASVDDMNLLIAKRFILIFEDGVIVVKHWKINNYIQKDRYVPTKYARHKATLALDKNGAYTLASLLPADDQKPAESDVYRVYTQDRVGKDRIGKDIYTTTSSPSESYSSLSSYAGNPLGEKPTLEMVRRYAANIGTMSVDPDRFYLWYEERSWRGVTDWRMKLKEWEAHDGRAE